MTKTVTVTSAKCCIAIDSESKTLVLSQETKDNLQELCFNVCELEGLIDHLQYAKKRLIKEIVKGGR